MKATVKLTVVMEIEEEQKGLTIEDIEKQSHFKCNSEEQRIYMEESIKEILKEELGEHLTFFKIVKFKAIAEETEVANE